MAAPLIQVSEFLLVFHGCGTNDHTLSSLAQPSFLSSQLCRSELCAQCDWLPCSGSHMMRWWWTCCVPFWRLWGRVLSKPIHPVSQIQFPSAGGLRPLFHHWLSAWGRTHLLEAGCGSSPPCGAPPPPMPMLPKALLLQIFQQGPWPLQVLARFGLAHPKKPPCLKVEYLWPELHLQSPFCHRK